MMHIDRGKVKLWVFTRVVLEFGDVHFLPLIN